MNVLFFPLIFLECFSENTHWNKQNNHLLLHNFGRHRCTSCCKTFLEFLQFRIHFQRRCKYLPFHCFIQYAIQPFSFQVYNWITMFNKVNKLNNYLVIHKHELKGLIPIYPSIHLYVRQLIQQSNHLSIQHK